MRSHGGARHAVGTEDSEPLVRRLSVKRLSDMVPLQVKEGETNECEKGVDFWIQRLCS